MGRKGYNWKARRVVNTVVDDTASKKIELDIDLKASGTYDSSNQLVLPSQKRKTKVKNDGERVTRILSKKHRKKLEKIVDKKKKKENRATLLEALQSVQVGPDELQQLTSIASVQTKGLKRYQLEQSGQTKTRPKRDVAILEGTIKLNSIAGSKKRKIQCPETIINTDPNVVGFEVSESESDNDTDSDSESNANKKLKQDDDRVATKTETDSVVEIKTVDEIKVDSIEDKNKSETVESSHCNIVKAENESISKMENRTPTVNHADAKPKTIDRTPAVFVEVNRRDDIQKARLKLPILAEEQVIMETIKENPVVILAGETGSGKTTQLPQFLYEAGYARDRQIAITEPRRVAAIAMSKRVADEMNLTSEEVSYLIRFEGNVTDSTKLKFMTDGVLLKEVQNDFLLSKYSVVVLDEAHERSVYTDILIGLLSRIVPLRCKRGDPLKLIIMSATLRLKDFTENTRLFKISPPVIKVETRQFPVTVHFNRQTKDDYMKEAFSKAVKIHTTLPDGGILIFVTGQLEVNALVRKLRKAFPSRRAKTKACNNEHVKDGRVEVKLKNKTDEETENYNVEEMEGTEDEDKLKMKSKKQKKNEKLAVDLKKKENSSDGDVEDDIKVKIKGKKKKMKMVPKVNLDDYSVPGDNEVATDDELSDGSDTDCLFNMKQSQPLWVSPLYSLLPAHKQAKVFDGPPPGCRFCVVTTNVSETSLTIPNIKYVIDTGKTKVKMYDKVTGVTSYVVTWTSKASADQRAGRAGRLGPGHCYRLYSSAVFNDTFQDFSVPEIQQKPVDDLYLQMKCMNIDKVSNFPFPTAPDLLQLKTAEGNLKILGALKDAAVTPLGRAISKFPVLPRYGKMLALSHQHDLLPYTICLVAALSVQEVLLETPVMHTSPDEIKNVRRKWSAIRQQWAGVGNSLLLGDPMVLLHAIGAAEYANCEGKLESYCQENGLRHKAVIEIRKLRIQLTNEIKLNVPEADVIVDPKLKPPTDLQAKLLRQILLSGMGDRVAKKIMPDEINDDQNKSKYKYAYHASNLEDPVFLHQGSVLRKTLPEFVIYQEIYETNKMYMRGVTVIEPEWLPIYVPTLCNLSEPLVDPPPRYDESTGKVYCTITGTYGKQAWTLPNVEIEYPKTVDAYRWFARFLLEGKVFPQLSKYNGFLLSSPGVMLKSWAKLQPRTEKLLNALMSQEVRDMQRLAQIWTTNPKYLLPEYLLWLPESARSEVSLIWPPVPK